MKLDPNYFTAIHADDSIYIMKKNKVLGLSLDIFNVNDTIEIDNVGSIVIEELKKKTLTLKAQTIGSTYQRKITKEVVITKWRYA